MARVRRSRYLCFFCDDFPFLDVGLLLRGTVEPVTVRQLYALSILRGETVPLSAEEFDLAASTPLDDWVEAVDEGAARGLARKGVLLSDENDPELDTLRARHESLEGMLVRLNFPRATGPTNTTPNTWTHLVATWDGATALTLTPCGAHSTARLRVSCVTPPLLA